MDQKTVFSKGLPWLGPIVRFARNPYAFMQAAHDAFYRGDIAREITAFQAREGGFLSMADMANYHSPLEPAPLRDVSTIA